MPLFDLVQNTVFRIVDALNSEDYATVAAHMAFPFMMEHNGRSVVYPRAADAMVSWAAFRTQLKSMGYAHSQARIMAMELPRRNRLRLWVTLIHSNATGSKQIESDLILYLRLSESGLLIEMQQNVTHSVPGEWASAGELRLPA